jgi:hypothetical protein
MTLGRPYLGTFMLVFNQAMPHMVPAVMFGLADGCRVGIERRVPGSWTRDHCRIQAETEDANLAL